MAEKAERKIRILIADDDYSIRKAFRECIIKSRYEIADEVSDGISAVESARKLHPDMAVLDIEMPVMDGITASRIILEEGSAFCTVMLTSFEEENYVRSSIENGAEGYITKPFSREQLLAVLDMSFNQSKERYLLKKDCANLKRKIDNKDLTNRAKLVIMEKKGLDENEAYKYLRELSRRKNISVETVSELVLAEWENQKSE